jgi:hypothetical protein
MTSAHEKELSPPELSAVVVVGKRRVRGQRVLANLCAQTAVDRIEIVVVDIGPEDDPPLVIDAGVRSQYTRQPHEELWGRARSYACRQARAPVVAFLEEHCFPAPGWAEALLRAHEGPWAAVGYAFTNDNPETYVGRASLVKDYGPWMHPVKSGPSTLLPGNNVSYKRDLLLGFGEELDHLLTPDFSIQRRLAQAGHLMCLEPEALAAHQNFEQVWASALANYHYARFLAARRVGALGWGASRRIVQGVLTPAGAPLIGVIRLFRSLDGREGLRPLFVASLPVYLTVAVVAAVGEALGYLFGEGSSERAQNYWEAEYPRVRGQ